MSDSYLIRLRNFLQLLWQVISSLTQRRQGDIFKSMLTIKKNPTTTIHDGYV